MPRERETKAIQPAQTPLNDLRWGLERETHRINPDGSLSAAPHPEALCTPSFTRDFAESQLEIVTQPHATICQAVAELEELTAAAQHILGPERLWPFSMPPRLPPDSQIPIARLGFSETARRNVIYRRGLALRYGYARQMICGVHVNASLGPALVSLVAKTSPLTSEERRAGNPRDALYLRLARNLYADLPHLVLLFGASPVLGGGAPEAGPSAISYRNSRYGYARAEFQPYLDLSSLEAYLAGIRRGLRTESTAFARLGLARDGRLVQLNANVFQMDNEFYAPIRLRQALQPGESTLQAIARRGVGYIELRVPDVDPFQRAGIAKETLRLLHLFLLSNLARPSIPRGNSLLRRDLELTKALALRCPDSLARDPLLVAARQRLTALELIGRQLDAASGDRSYTASLALFESRLDDPGRLLSASLSCALAESGMDWTAFGVHTALRLTPRAPGTANALDRACCI